MIQDKIDQDLKTAMLARDEQLVLTLRGLKSALQYQAVAKGADSSLDESEVISVLQKEAKKRQEAAELYKKGQKSEQEEKELAEKAIIEKYLPEQLSEEELKKIIDHVEEKTGGLSRENMGKAIGIVKEKTAGRANGAAIASLIRSRIRD